MHRAMGKTKDWRRRVSAVHYLQSGSYSGMNVWKTTVLCPCLVRTISTLFDFIEELATHAVAACKAMLDAFSSSTLSVLTMKWAYKLH